jgi:hypothetical protein
MIEKMNFTQNGQLFYPILNIKSSGWFVDIQLEMRQVGIWKEFVTLVK